jgi:soluble lytic murein transglycosylase-like protein
MRVTLRVTSIWTALSLAVVAGDAFAGAQKHETLPDSVKNALHSAVSDQAPPVKDPTFASMEEKFAWFSSMSQRLAKKIPDGNTRYEFLQAVHYEARRAGLDPQLVLGLIQVESNFRKHAVSAAGARGYMQVMPFWVREIGNPGDNLFHLQPNLVYGCAILKLYLDIEHGDYYRALGRYNGSLGQPEYPQAVVHAWKTLWNFEFNPSASVSGVTSGKL